MVGLSIVYRKPGSGLCTYIYEPERVQNDVRVDRNWCVFSTVSIEVQFLPVRVRGVCWSESAETGRRHGVSADSRDFPI